MDLKLSPTPTKSADDTEIDTPPHTHNYSQPKASIKNHLSPPPPPPAVVVTYKECLKNHAAALAGHAVDGCGEFMPSSSSTTDPTSLKCAACGCHRNFHRREPDSPPTPITPPFLDFRYPFQPKRSSLSPSSPPPLLPIRYGPNTLLALSTAEEHHQAPVTPNGEYPVGRKRFRTKFSQEQKEKMQSFSEKLGWKMQRRDEGEVEEFCSEVGVTKGVLRVWMHNNKNTLGKKLEIGSNNGGRVISFENINNNNNNGDGGGVFFRGSNNGSSSNSSH